MHDHPPTVPPVHDPRADLRDDPLRFGVGARVTLALMRDDYATAIPDLLEQVPTDGLTLETGDVSTYVGGAESDLLRYLTDLAAAAAATGSHASLVVLLSRGCPGEAVCELPGGAGPRVVPVPTGRTVGRYATAEWSLYPLADGADADHMAVIEEAIAQARATGVVGESRHFATALRGDVGEILAAVVGAWTTVGTAVQHVTSHLTISLNSPSHAGTEGADAIR